MLENFAEPYLQFVQAVDQQLYANLNDAAKVQQLYRVLLVCVKIFHSLICQDLPEFVEDNMLVFMEIWKKHLTFADPALATEVLMAFYSAKSLTQRMKKWVWGKR